MRFITNRNIIKVLLLSFITVFSNCKKNNDTPVSDSSYPQYGTPFSNVPATQDAIIYQVNVRAFKNSKLSDVTARLDSIKALGVNVVYLMPIYPIGILKKSRGLGSPYSVKDYKAVNPEFGSLEDLRTLVNGAHQRNMAVMLDWVGNHTSWDNAWISNKSWYQQDASGNIIYPAGTTFTDVAALNYNNQDMRSAMIDAMKYWVFTANIDGFRCDFADNVPFDFWKQDITALRSITTHKLLMLAEGTRSDHFNAGFNMVYAFAFYAALEGNVFGNSKSVTLLQDVNTSEYASALPGSQVVRYTTNNDNDLYDGSPVNLLGGKTGSMSAFLVTAYMKGVPMIYTGQEVGCAQNIDFFNQTPIDWATNPDMTAEYKKILNFRAGSDAVKNGQLSQFSSDDVVAFTKSTDTQKVLVIANLRNNAVTYTLPASLSAMSGWKNAFTGASVTLNSQIFLQPYQHMVLTH